MAISEIKPFLSPILFGIRDIVGFHGNTIEELETGFDAAVDHYLESAKNRTYTTPDPIRFWCCVRPEVKTILPRPHRSASLQSRLRTKPTLYSYDGLLPRHRPHPFQYRGGDRFA